MSQLTPDEASALLAEILANHFPGATTEGPNVDLAFEGMRAHCKATLHDRGTWTNASLLFWFTGGPWGARWVFASGSGYANDARSAIVTGGCNWACTFVPVLRAALGAPPHPDHAAPAPIEVTVAGAPMRLLVDGLDRALGTGGDTPSTETAVTARRHLAGDAWLAQRVLGALPILTPDRPTLLSVFVAEAQTTPRLVEVKLDGMDWPAAHDTFADVPSAPIPGMAMLREIAMLVPAGPAARFTRDALERTLAGFAAPLGDAHRAAVAWLGWATHDGELEPPMSARALADLEGEIGPLPPDYRRFLLEVAESGAGPGYGLVSPDHSAQVALAEGRFPWDAPTESPDTPPAGALVLAHAGCSTTWLLVLEGAHRGEVWVHAAGADGGVRPVAPSFDSWYRAWLDTCVGDAGPWLHWDPRQCATAGAISKLCDAQDAKGAPADDLSFATFALSAGWSAAFHEGDAVDPCEGCCDLLGRFKVPPSGVKRGLPPLQAR